MTKKTLNILCFVWNSDNSGIFDYNCKDIAKIFHTTKNDILYYTRSIHNKINSIKKHSQIKKDDIVLFKIRYSKKYNAYEIINPVRKMKYNFKNAEELNNKIWLVMKSSKNCLYEVNNDEYYLKENDIIKFGRKKYIIIKKNVILEKNNILSKDNINYNNNNYEQIFNIKLNSNQYYQKIINVDSNIEQNNEIKELEGKKNKEYLQIIQEEKKEDKSDDITVDKSQDGKSVDDNYKSISDVKSIDNDGYNNDEDCRICFGRDSTKENPKLKLCNCHSYIHYNCLKYFLKQNITINENDKSTVISYTCERFNCEVCEKPYPLRFQIQFDKNKEPITYYLIDGLQLPEDTNYMILESLTCVKEKQNYKNIYVIKLTGDDITIGRNDKNDIIDTDISMSRFHSVLKFNKDTGNITLENESKFGTLVLVKNNIKLTDNKKIYFQVGRTFITAEQKNGND